MDNKTHFQDLNNKRHLLTDVEYLTKTEKAVFQQADGKTKEFAGLFLIRLKDGIDYSVSQEVYDDVKSYFAETTIASNIEVPYTPPPVFGWK